MKRTKRSNADKKRVSKIYYRKKLRKLLEKTKLRDLLIMIWAAESLRSGQADDAKRFLNFPEEAVAAKPGNRYFVAPWTLETLVNEALTHKSATATSRRYLNTSKWDGFAQKYNLLNEVENAESLDDIPEGGILDAMPRIGWRQFGWQSGYRSSRRYFRAWWLYNFKEANDYFQENYGITVEQFSFVGFGVAAQLVRFPAVKIDEDFQVVGISQAEQSAFFRLTTSSPSDARKRAIDLRSGTGQIAYKPSALRRKPLIEIGQEAFCPLPDLLHLRVSDGIFYDLIGNDNLRRLVAERFETYAAEVTQHYVSPYTIRTEENYGPRAKRLATPDLRIVNEQSELCVIVECKARRIPFRVMSSSNPFAENAEIYADLVKGVLQVWRYVSDVRRGSADAKWSLADDAIGVVLMLEPWLQMHNDAVKEVLQAAERETAKYTEILATDRIPIAFVAIDDWEFSIRRVNVSGFLRALAIHAKEDRAGFMLDSSVKSIASEHAPSVSEYDYWAALSKVTNWWADLAKHQTQ